MDDSRIYANHAKKKVIDLDDVRLAVKMQLERTFTNPPPRDILLDVARAKNNVPLPSIKPNNGLRLPPDRYCLNAMNFKLKNSTKKIVGKPAHSLMGNATSGGQCRVKVEGNKTGLSIVKRPGTLATVARTQTISIPKPVLKFSTGNKSNPIIISKFITQYNVLICTSLCMQLRSVYYSLIPLFHFVYPLELHQVRDFNMTNIFIHNRIYSH